MDPYTTDDETVEKLRQWWKDNGAWILGGIALGAAILFAWRYWTDYREQQLTYASDHYEQVLAASDAGDYLRALELTEGIRALRLPTPYGDLSALAVARNAAVGGDPDEARARLQQVVDGAGDAETGHLARLRLARLHLAEGDVDAAGALVSPRDAGRYEPLYAELRGDVAAARGNHDDAVAAYRAALGASTDGIVDRALLQMKLNDLGEV